MVTAPQICLRLDFSNLQPRIWLRGITFVREILQHGTPPCGWVLDGTENPQEAQFGSRAFSVRGAPGFACRWPAACRFGGRPYLRSHSPRPSVTAGHCSSSKGADTYPGGAMWERVPLKSRRTGAGTASPRSLTSPTKLLDTAPARACNATCISAPAPPGLRNFQTPRNSA